MTTFVLIPGAGGAAEVYWREVSDALREHGHVAVPVEMAGDDPRLGLPEYAALVDEAIGEHRDVVLVAQSMGGFTAPMIDRLDRVARIVLLNAMIPLPGETPGEWGRATGSEQARHRANREAGRPDTFDLETLFLHDIPEERWEEMSAGDRDPAETPFGQPCTFEDWPDVPTHVLVGADDRLFPASFQVRVARERLGVEADVMPGGHLVAKSRPAEVAEWLLTYAGGQVGSDAAVPFDLDTAADEVRRVAHGVRDDQLARPTPCADWTVRDLAAHVCDLTRAFTTAARGSQDDGAPTTELPQDWRTRLDRDLEALVAAWRDPAAWQGEAEAGGVTMPAAEMAVVALDELVLHGWDLARATDQAFGATDRDVALCTTFAATMSTPDMLDSRQGLYGPLVDPGPDPAPLDRLLGLAGRDPSWH